MLGGCDHTERLLCGDGRGTALTADNRIHAVRASELVVEVAGLPVDVEYRREVAVHPGVEQVLRCAGARGLRRANRVRRRADLLLGDPRGAGKPLHDAALLVGHQQQWVSDAAVRLRLRQFAGHRLNLTAVSCG